MATQFDLPPNNNFDHHHNHEVTSEISKSRQVSFVGVGLPVDASSKNIENNTTTSGTVPPKKNSLLRRVKEYQVERRSEKFYRFLHHDLNLILTYVGSLCVLYHLFCVLVRECENKPGPKLQKFTDGVLRLTSACFLCFVVIRKAPQFWHVPLYFWMGLNLYAYDWTSDGTTAMCILTGTFSIIISILISARELRFYYESPKLYRSFSQNASLVDERGRILFYSRLKAALVEAGATADIESRQINILLDGLEIFEKSVDDPTVIIEEVYLTFDQFALLYESYCRLCDAGVQFGGMMGNAAGKNSSSKIELPTIKAPLEIQIPVTAQTPTVTTVSNNNKLDKFNDHNAPEMAGGNTNGIVSQSLGRSTHQSVTPTQSGDAAVADLDEIAIHDEDEVEDSPYNENNYGRNTKE